MWVKEVKYSDKYQREYTMMHTSEEDYHSSKFALMHNVNKLVRGMMELFLSDIIIQMIRRHKDSQGRAKANIFRDVTNSIFWLLFITWVLSHFHPIHTIVTPEACVQSKNHATMCHFLVSSKYGQTSTSPQFTSIMYQRKIHREKL